MNGDEYVYEIINNENDARICAELIAEEFSTHNPITIFDKITSKCFFEHCSWPLIKDMLDERLSFQAKHRSSGEIIGAVFAGDLYTYHHRHPYDGCSPPSVIPVSDLLDEMDNTFISHDFGRELKPNLVVHITVAAIRAQHSGFKYALVQVTSQATRHIYVNKMGGKEVTTVDSTTWIWKKKKSDQLLYPYKDYKHGSIPNILIELKSN
ncbi:unnamed protein product [Rotaria sp. Silwood1]|nr:unnamed protein product [Rotaria sp. Silwood1]CAF3695415.1 unnamed protein product [Rotaria sp. Silwood1]CAF4778650.1 unnamed protein product [Rotaria sp. Silwood1]CAF5046251.1 unnamed protein product [Rotaria sp. Silwood1]